jgi:hypothetical protein
VIAGVAIVGRQRRRAARLGEDVGEAAPPEAERASPTASGTAGVNGVDVSLTAINMAANSLLTEAGYAVLQQPDRPTRARPNSGALRMVVLLSTPGTPRSRVRNTTRGPVPDQRRRDGEGRTDPGPEHVADREGRLRSVRRCSPCTLADGACVSPDTLDVISNRVPYLHHQHARR